MNLSPRTLRGLEHLSRDTVLDAAVLGRLLRTRLLCLGNQQRKWVEEAHAIAAYHANVGYPVARLLLGDDAPQFGRITEALALRWIHEGRHHEQLCPHLPTYQALLHQFLIRFWTYYPDLLTYQQAPTLAEQEWLTIAFEALFTTRRTATGRSTSGSR